MAQTTDKIITMIAGLKRRLRKIEEQDGSRWGDTAAAADRITRAVLAFLSDAEFETAMAGLARSSTRTAQRKSQ